MKKYVVTHRNLAWSLAVSIAVVGASFAKPVKGGALPAHSVYATAATPQAVGNTVATALTLTGDYTPPVTWAIVDGTLPDGLALDADSGEVTGTPTTPGASDFTISATDTSTPPQVANSAQSILVAAAPPIAISMRCR